MSKYFLSLSCLWYGVSSTSRDSLMAFHYISLVRASCEMRLCLNVSACAVGSYFGAPFEKSTEAFFCFNLESVWVLPSFRRTVPTWWLSPALWAYSPLSAFSSLYSFSVLLLTYFRVHKQRRLLSFELVDFLMMRLLPILIFRPGVSVWNVYKVNNYKRFLSPSQSVRINRFDWLSLIIGFLVRGHAGSSAVCTNKTQRCGVPLNRTEVTQGLSTIIWYCFNAINCNQLIDWKAIAMKINWLQNLQLIAIRDYLFVSTGLGYYCRPIRVRLSGLG